MAEELTRSLTILSERGEPRGATAVLEAARQELDTAVDVRPLRRLPGPAMAIAAAVAIIVAIGAVVITVRLLGIDSAPVVTTIPDSTTTTVEDPLQPLPESVIPFVPDAMVADDVPGATQQALNDVGALAVDDGVLWSSTGGRVIRTDLGTITSELLPFGEDLPVSGAAGSRIAVAPDGTVWAVSPWDKWVARYQGDGWTEIDGFRDLDLAPTGCPPATSCKAVISAMAFGPDGTLYLAVGIEILVVYDGQSWAVERVDPRAAGADGDVGWALDLDVAPDGTLWAAGLDDVLAHEDGEWTRYTAADGVPSGLMTSITVTTDGDVWVGGQDAWRGEASGGIGRFDGRTWSVFSETDGMADTEITALTSGPGGVVWAAHSTEIPSDSPNQRAPGAISRFDGTGWSSTTVEDVGVGFGYGGATVDGSGDLWVASRFGIMRFDGNEATLLPVGSAVRPPVDMPHTVVEGGTDVLATAVAQPPPAPAECPAGSQPDEAGSADQQRPRSGFYATRAAFDRESGVVVVFDESGYPWLFDVCTNAWEPHSPEGFAFPVQGPVTYDIDSDLIVAVNQNGRAGAYDANTNTWIELESAPAPFGWYLQAIYDPVSGLVVVRDGESSALWAVDVESDQWSPVRQGQVAPPTTESTWSEWAQAEHVFDTQTLVYDPTIDRLVLHVGDNHFGAGSWEGAGLEMTWTFDPRIGTWALEPITTPELGWFNYGVYHEANGVAVFAFNGSMIGYQGSSRTWSTVWSNDGPSGEFGLPIGPLNRHADWVVYDSINERVLMGGGEARMSATQPVWDDMDDVWAFDSDTGIWLELVPPSTP